MVVNLGWNIPIFKEKKMWTATNKEDLFGKAISFTVEFFLTRKAADQQSG
jgi:hypothetical protein